MIGDWLAYLPKWHLSESFSFSKYCCYPIVVCIGWCKMSTQSYVLGDHMTVRLCGRSTQIWWPSCYDVLPINKRAVRLLADLACRFKLARVIAVNGDEWVLASGSSLGFTAFSATCTSLALTCF